MNLRDQAIIDWAKETRPDIVHHLENIRKEEANGDHGRALYFLLVVGFEAGRKFQAENPKKPLDNPNIYLTVG